MRATHPLPMAICASGFVRALSATALFAQQPLPPMPTPETPPPVQPILQNYKPVTADRLKQQEDGNWLQYRLTYDGWGYSPLAQITRKTRTG
jgi:alcohol dehydrogenase (cytochrome c)